MAWSWYCPVKYFRHNKENETVFWEEWYHCFQEHFNACQNLEGSRSELEQQTYPEKKECLKMSPSNKKSLFPRYNQSYSGGKASGNFIMLRNTTKNS